MRSRRSAVLVPIALLPIALVLAGCTAAQPSAPPTTAVAEPTPTPTITSPSPDPAGPPALSDLVLSTEGLGTLVIGQPIDPALATFDPLGCRTPENQDLYPEDDAIWEAWLPKYDRLAVPGGFEAYPFEPHHNADGTLRWLRVQSPEIRTADGLGLGSTREEVLAAHPDAAVVPADYATVYYIDGEVGRLVFEVVDDESALGIPEGEVYLVHVDPVEWTSIGISGGDAGGWCAVEV